MKKGQSPRHNIQIYVYVQNMYYTFYYIGVLRCISKIKPHTKAETANILCKYVSHWTKSIKATS